MSADRRAVDTNVLVYACLSDSPQHAASAALIEQARDPAAGLCLFPQMVAEFFATVTNRKRVTNVMTGPVALAALDRMLALPGLAVLPVPPDVVSQLFSLLRAAPVTGRQVFDYQLAATMLLSGVSGLYTYNVKDFAGIPGVTAEEPPVSTAAPA